MADRPRKGRTKMTEDEFRRLCHKHSLSIAKACDLVFIKTAAIIKPQSISKAFADYGTLSEPMTGLFRLLFLMLEREGGSHEKI